MRTLLIWLLIFSPTAWAHNVVGGVYARGADIEGEAGFSNGDSAKPGLKVEVLATEGRLLGTTETDEEGMFFFTASQRIDHQFRINMGAGHLLELTLPVNELPQRLSEKGGIVQSAIVESVEQSVVESYKPTSENLQLLIEKAVARQVTPLRKELVAYKEKAGMRDIIGGVGYIFGLCGVAIMIRQRKLNRVAP